MVEPSQERVGWIRGRKHPIRLDRIDELAWRAAEETWLAGLMENTRPTSGPLWPDEYREQSAEAAYHWLTECWVTDNEADQLQELVPSKSFVREFSREWFESFRDRRPMIVEKSRRLMVSWICMGLETWQLGLSRGSSMIIDQTEDNAKEHLWRAHFALSELEQRRPDMKLSGHEFRGSGLMYQISHLVLPNGSVMTVGHQNAGAAQGKGKTIIRLEEISKYRNPSAFWGQALIVTQGKGDGAGGWVYGIANSSPHEDWRNIKCKASARKLLNLE